MLRKSGSVCTVTRRLECTSDNGEQRLRQDFEICEFLAFSYMHQLLVFIRIVFKDKRINLLTH